MSGEQELTKPSWRVATPSDDEAIIELVMALYAEDPSPEPIAEGQARATLEALRREPLRGRAVALASDREIAGYAFLISFWSNELGGETCEIDELFVVERHRGHGHASRLIEALSSGSTLWPRSAVALCLQVTPTNHRALSLYERLGFERRKNLMLTRRPPAR